MSDHPRPRRNRFVQLVSESSLYIVGNGLRRGMGIITMPILTRYLSTSGYGMIAVLGTVQNMLEVVYEFGMAAAATRFYYDCRDDRERQTLFGTLLLFSLATTLVLTLGLLLAGAWMWSGVGRDIPFHPYVALTVGTVCLGSIGVLPRVLFRVRNEVPTFFRLTLAQSVLTVALMVLFVVGFGAGPIGPVVATFIAAAAFAAVYAWHLRGHVRLVFSGALVRRALAFGLPEIPVRFGGWALKVADRLILQHLTSLAVVGVYSVGYSVSRVAFDLVANGIHWAIVPFFYHTATTESDRTSKTIFARVSTYNFTVLVGLGLASVLFAPELIVLLAGERYRDANQVVPLVVAASVLQAAFYIPSKGLYLKSKTGYLPALVMVPAAVNIALNFLLIPRLGMLGAAWAHLVAYALMIVLTLVVSQKVYPIPYEWGRIAKVAGIGLALGVGRELGTDAPLLATLAIKTLLIVAFPAVLYLVGFFEGREIDWMRARLVALVQGRGYA